jgi:hypothetical protein
MKKFIYYNIMLFLFVTLNSKSFAQLPKLDTSYLYWGESTKLGVQDFLIKVNGKIPGHSSGQFGIEVDPLVGRFSFGVSRNYKKLIRNYFHRSSSWIDTTSDPTPILRYYQIMWDMWEVQVRKFRQDVSLNRKVIYKGLLTFKELESTRRIDFANWLIKYETETEFGRNEEKLTYWEKKIQEMLDELKDYDITALPELIK